MNARRINLYAEIVFIIFVFTFCLGWTVIQTFDAAPDEYMRYQIPQYIYNHGTLPHGGDPEIRNPFWGISYGFTPILSYIISAAFMKITSFFTTAKPALILAARMVSVLCVTGTVAFGFAIAKKIFHGMQRWMFVVLFSMLPQFVFISSYVNVDALAMLSTAMIIYAWIIGLQSDWDLKSCIFLGVGISVCALAYYNAYGFILCSIFLFVFSILFTSEKPWSTLIKKGLIVSVIVLVLAGWWFVRSYIIYDGDILGLKTSTAYGEMYAKDKFKPSNIQTPQKQGHSIIEMLVGMHWMKTTFSSFIGRFGYLNIVISKWIYKVYIGVFLAGFAGVLAQFRVLFPLFKVKKTDSDYKEKCNRLLFNITMVIAMVVPVIINIIYSYTNDFQAQGRYSMPMLLPLAYFTITGIGYLFQCIVRNKIAQRILAGVFCAGCIYIALFCYFKILLPHYPIHLIG